MERGLLMSNAGHTPFNAPSASPRIRSLSYGGGLCWVVEIMLFVERIETAELWNDCVDYVEGYENAAPAANETKRAANVMVHLCQGLISADERDRMTK